MPAPDAPDAEIPARPLDRAGIVDPRLLEVLVCPMTRGPLRYDRARQELISLRGRIAFPLRQGVPMLTPDEARPLEDAELRAPGASPR